jgi:hypothetical protein
MADAPQAPKKGRLFMLNPALHWVTEHTHGALTFRHGEPVEVPPDMEEEVTAHTNATANPPAPSVIPAPEPAPAETPPAAPPATTAASGK